MHKYLLSDMKKVHRSCAISSYELQKWNKKLDLQKLETFNHQQQIKKQSKMSSLINTFYIKSVKQIQNEAIQLNAKFEEEKTKNQRLQFLVKTISNQLYLQKVVKYQHVKINKQAQQQDQQNKKLFQVQKQLKLFSDRLNSSKFEVQKKIQQIRSLRGERTVHSQQFKKIQKQFFDIEFYYKQLLIQRKLCENTWQKLNQQFGQLYQNSNSNYEKVFQKIKHQKEIQYFSQNVSRVILNQKIHVEDFDIWNTSYRNNQIFSSSNEQMNNSMMNFNITLNNYPLKGLKTRNKIQLTSKKTLTFIMETKRHQEQINKINYKKKVLQILHDFQVQSVKQLMDKDVKQIYNGEQLNSIYQESNQLQQLISQQQKSIKQLSRQICTRKSIPDHNIQPRLINLKRQIIQFQNQSSQIKDQILSFKQEFQTIFQHIEQELNQTSHLTKSFASKQKSHHSSDLTFIQNKEELKEMMTVFNEIFLEKIMQTSGTCLDNVMLKKKKIRTTKNFAHFQSKISKKSSNNYSDLQQTQRSQTSNQLNTILNIKNQKNQRNLGSILSQQQFIEQSIKAIRTCKKKSNFLK